MLRFFCVMWFALLAVSAAPIVLDERGETVNVVPSSLYLMEEGATRYTPEEAAEHPERFRPAEEDIYNFGFVRKPVWIRFDVRFSPDTQKEWILRIDNPHIDRYDFYRIGREGNLTLVGRGGDRTRQAAGRYRSRTFWEPLRPADGTAAAYLLHLQTEGSLQIPLTAESLDSAYRREAFTNFLFGLYYGVLLLLLIYNLVLYIVVREVHYVNYLLFLGSYLLFQLNFDGVGREWLWPHSEWMVNRGLAFFIFLSAFFAFRFARYFLLLKKYAGTTERIVLSAEVFSVLGMLVSLLLKYHVAITLAAVWSAVIPWILIYAGLKVWPVYRAARYYLVGWIVFLLATILIALNKLGLVPSSPVLLYMQQIGSLLQMLLLSFALADRINMMKAEHLKKLRDFNRQLQEKIATKVEELRQKDQMMIQQSRQAAMGEMIENIAHQWRQPLNQLGLVQSGIFFDYALGTLDEKKLRKYQEQSETLMRYMTQTIDDFRNFFLPDRQTGWFSVCDAIEKALELLKSSLTRYHIRVETSCDGFPKAYGHENEFSQVIINIVNNARDAMLERRVASPRIAIAVRGGDNGVRIEICDNGGGIDTAIIAKVFDPYFTTKFQSQGTGIGLYMVKMIVEKSMKGSISVRNEGKGACFIIEQSRERTDAQ